MSAQSTSAQSWDVIRTAARRYEPDRYLAALLAPRSARADLITLAAFTGQINRIADAVTDPHLAQIRLQWWNDAVLARPRAATGNPIADAFTELLDRRNIAAGLVENWLDEFVTTLYPAPPEDTAALEHTLDLAEGSPFMLAALILGEPLVSDEVGQLTRHGGVAYGLSRLGLSFPHALSRGKMPLPRAISEPSGPDRFIAGNEPGDTGAKTYIVSHARSELARLQARFPHASPAVRTALLPAALVEPYLRALERQDHDIQTDIGDVAPLVRVWRIWRAHATGRM